MKALLPSPVRALTLMSVMMPMSGGVIAATLAIMGGRIHTVSSRGIVEDGTVVIEDGRIADVRPGPVVPQGAGVVDARGTWITPGIFNACSKLGLTEIWGADATRDDAATRSRFTAAFDVRYGINSDSTLIPITRVAGITRSAVFPTAASSMFAGYGALIHL